MKNKKYYSKHISKIQPSNKGDYMYRVELKPNYIFSFNNSSITILKKGEIRKAVKHIVFCDGE